MDFDEAIEQANQPEKINTTPTIVEETIKFGGDIVDTDYLPIIKDIEILKPYLEGWRHLNLYSCGWRFQFGSSKSWAGLCSPQDRQNAKSKDRNIYVSIEFVKHDENWKDNMKTVIYHEVCHAIVVELFMFTNKQEELHKVDPMDRFAQGHGLIWNELCKTLNGSVCPPTYEGAKFKESIKEYRYVCFNCGHTEYGDYLKFASECSKCGKAVICEHNPL